MDIVTAGIDFLTCHSDDQEQTGRMYREALLQLKLAEERGEKIRKWGFVGYRGLQIATARQGHFAYGEKDHSILIQMSGQWVRESWLKWWLMSKKVTRIDFAVDITIDQQRITLAKEYFDYLEEMDSAYPVRRLILGGRKTGQTLYVGSRQSESFGRVYDKGAQQGDMAGVNWRYEVEYKHKMASLIAGKIGEIGAHEALTAENVELSTSLSAVLATVYDWFDNRYVPPLFKRTADDGLIGLKVEKHSHMDKLLWLRQQVSPTTRRLIMAGIGDEILEALGVTDFYTFTPK